MFQDPDYSLDKDSVTSAALPTDLSTSTKYNSSDIDITLPPSPTDRLSLTTILITSAPLTTSTMITSTTVSNASHANTEDEQQTTWDPWTQASMNSTSPEDDTNNITASGIILSR